MTAASLPVATAAASPNRLGRFLTAAAAIFGPFLVIIGLDRVMGDRFPAWAKVLPDGAVIPIVDWLESIFGYLRNEKIFGFISVKGVSRAIAGLLDYPLELAEGLLTTGYEPLGLPALPWPMLVAIVALLGAYLSGWRLALLAGGCMFYLALFDVWEDSMVTLSTVIISAPIAALIGLLLGVWGARSSRVEAVLSPLLNVAQSMPHFAYFIPIAVFVGISHKAGVIATILFAIPPMTRLTMLGLKSVPSEVREAGLMSGSTARQMLWKVEIPSARPQLMVGINQVIMQCLGMTVLAAFIGTRGLGAKLLNLLQALRIGDALERGLAVVLIAIMLDRLSQAAGRRRPEHRDESLPWWRAHGFAVASATVVVASIIFANLFDFAHTFPENWTITTSDFWEAVVDYVQVEWRDPLRAFKDFVAVEILKPMRDGFGAMPWIALLVLVASLGWRIGGWRLAATVSSFLAFIAFTGFWVESMETLYLVVAAVIVSTLGGVPVGIWAAGTDRRAAAMQVVLDTFQTLPSFIYLIPVVMLFQVGPVAALTAILTYAFVPAVRYTMLGLRNVPEDMLEAAATSGCNRRQTLWKVKLPLALPEIMLGINQVLMFGLLLAMIAAFIGGINGLGDEILIALRDQDAGKGLVVGLCLAFLGMTADQLVTRWSRRRKAQLGLADLDVAR